MVGGESRDPVYVSLYHFVPPIRPTMCSMRACSHNFCHEDLMKPSLPGVGRCIAIHLIRSDQITSLPATPG